MSGRYYNDDGYSPSHHNVHNVREAARSKAHPQHRVYEKVTRQACSTDNVSRPRISSSDYIPPLAHDRYSPPEHSTFGYASGSDYIDQPEESKSDYIDPDTPASYRRTRDRSSYDDRYDGGFSRSRSPVYYTRPPERDSRSDIDYAPPRTENSNYQIVKAGWGIGHDFMRSLGLKPGEHNAYEKASELLDKYRELDARSAADEYRARAGSVESDIAYRRRGSGYEDRELDERGSDIASYHNGAQSGRLSCASTAAESEYSSPYAARRGSDYASVPASNQRYSPSRSIRSGSERSLQSRSKRELSDDNGIAEGSDYMSSADGRSDICPVPGSEGYVSDHNGVAERSDYVSSQDGRSDVCSKTGSDGGSDNGGDDGDYMSDDREDCIGEDDYNNDDEDDD
jgi:hypothetical protein